jgi:hypothetical protein
MPTDTDHAANESTVHTFHIYYSLLLIKKNGKEYPSGEHSFSNADTVNRLNNLDILVFLMFLS